MPSEDAGSSGRGTVRYTDEQCGHCGGWMKTNDSMLWCPNCGAVPDDDVSGAYEGTTKNMVADGTNAHGQAMLRCLNCGKRVSKNYGNAKRHSCGDGADGSAYTCCGEQSLTDVWVEHDTDSAGTTKERKKECENCGERLALKEVR